MPLASETDLKAIILWLDVEMREISRLEVEKQVIKTLRLDVDVHNLNSIEAISGLLRRSAGFLCPCTEKNIVHYVEHSLNGLVNDMEEASRLIKETLENLISYGDLLECRESSEEDEGSAILLYTAPPAFVRIDSASVLLLGILPDRISLLPEELEDKIEYKRHIRRLSSEGNIDLKSVLVQSGLFELPLNTWLKAPKMQKANLHISRINKILDEAPPSGEIPGLTVLDSSTSVLNYRKRWASPDRLNGCFIARRTQLYGSDIWCYVEMKDGIPQKFIDFPIRSSIWRGCDEAWLLQAAIDHSLGHPQKYRVRSYLNESEILDFFSPVPAWVKRQFDVLGEVVESSDCLFSYCFRKEDVSGIKNFIKERLWLIETK